MVDNPNADGPLSCWGIEDDGTPFVMNIPMLSHHVCLQPIVHNAGEWLLVVNVEDLDTPRETVWVPRYCNFSKKHVLACDMAERTLDLLVSHLVLLHPPSCSHFEFYSLPCITYPLTEDQPVAGIYQCPSRHGSSFNVRPCLLLSNC